MQPKTRQEWLVNARLWAEMIRLNKQMGLDNDRIIHYCRKKFIRAVQMIKSTPRQSGSKLRDLVITGQLAIYPSGHVFNGGIRK